MAAAATSSLMATAVRRLASTAGVARRRALASTCRRSPVLVDATGSCGAGAVPVPTLAGRGAGVSLMQTRGMALWGNSSSTDKVEETGAQNSNAAATGDAGAGAGYTVVDAVEPELVADDAFAGLPGGADSRPLTAWFTKRNIPGSTKKLNLLARQIRGLSVNDAIAQMAFSPKNRGRVARHVIERAVSNADFYHGWTRDELCIEEAFVGKNAMYPRVRYHSRGRAGMAHLRYSQMTVHVRKMTDEELASVKKKQERWAAYDASRAPNPRQY